MNSAADDLIFKLVFGHERSKNLLIHLLNSIIVGANESPIVEVMIRKTKPNPECVGGKEERLDIVAEDSNKRIMNVRIQWKKKENFLKASLFHFSELYSQQLPKGGDCIDLHKTVCISILEENLLKDNRFWHIYHMIGDKTRELLTDVEEIHFLEIGKMNEFRKDSPITWWIEFLKNSHSDVVQQIGEFEPIIKEAVKVFDIVTSDTTTLELIRMRERELQDYNSDVGMQTVDEIKFLKNK